MRNIFAIVIVVLLSGQTSAHQFTPTYPKLKSSFVDGILVTNMELFNARTDVEYFELEVFDAEWNGVPFASEAKIVRVKHLDRKKLNVYIREKDRNRAVYICSKSKLIGSGSSQTMVASKICSKIK